MKVLVIPTWYPIDSDSLLGIYHKEFTESLNKNLNMTADMLFISRQKITSFYKYPFMKKKSILKETNYNVYMYKMLNVGRISAKLQLNNYVKVLRKAINWYIKENGRPDVIHANITIPAGYAASIVGKELNIPVLVQEHASYFKRFFEGNNKEIGKYVLDNSYFTVVSKYMVKEMQKYADNVEMLPNIVDTSIFKPQTHKKHDSIDLVIACALRQGKKIEDIFTAMKILIKDGYKVHLDIVGEGYLEKEYKELCNKLNLNKYVTFLGRKDKKDVAKIIAKNDIYVISSDIETFAIGGIEALACGVPVVSTKCLGPETYLTEEVGAFCEVGNPKSMAEAIIKVSKTQYDSKKLVGTAKRFSSEEIAKYALTLYEKITK